MKYHLVALFTIFAWGFTFVSTKVLLADISPLWILLLRFVLGLGILCVMRPHILRLKERTDEVLFAAAGATGIAAYYLLENVALVFTTATAVGVIVAASPLFTALSPLLSAIALPSISASSAVSRSQWRGLSLLALARWAKAIS